ncbi:MAG TPA: endo alpha-1,4 polygalactosaminidase [Kofleriaceae bacterium]|nr:endo alpha-1,4 polygalactosaminidase [Kofleriaceae bacterium]
MRSVPGLVLAFALLAGCKPDPYRPDAAPPYWKPKPGEYADWDIQLAAPFDISAPRKMYVLDLWAVIPTPTTLDYGDGAPVTVPAGALATAISDLHTRAEPAIVVCHVSTGAIRLTDPDAAKFPGYAGGAPPDRPTAPAGDSVIGWSRDPAEPNERFIDIRDNDKRATVATLIGKRIELAKTIGCDAIAARHNDMIAYEGQEDHGFVKVEYVEYVSWTNELAARAHAGRPISIGHGDGTSLMELDDTAKAFDFLIEERCGERQECDLTKAFLNKSKAVFEIEYDRNAEDEENDVDTVCGELSATGTLDGIVKSARLDSSFYMRCAAQP